MYVHEICKTFDSLSKEITGKTTGSSIQVNFCVNFSNSWVTCFFMIVCVCFIFFQMSTYLFVNNNYINLFLQQYVASSVNILLQNTFVVYKQILVWKKKKYKHKQSSS